MRTPCQAVLPPKIWGDGAVLERVGSELTVLPLGIDMLLSQHLGAFFDRPDIRLAFPPLDFFMAILLEIDLAPIHKDVLLILQGPVQNQSVVVGLPQLRIDLRQPGLNLISRQGHP